MSVEDRFKKRYKTGNTPWDIGKPDFNLTETVIQNPIKNNIFRDSYFIFKLRERVFDNVESRLIEQRGRVLFLN